MHNNVNTSKVDGKSPEIQSTMQQNFLATQYVLRRF